MNADFNRAKRRERSCVKGFHCRPRGVLPKSDRSADSPALRDPRIANIIEDVQYLGKDGHADSAVRAPGLWATRPKAMVEGLAHLSGSIKKQSTLLAAEEQE
jgi:hypothetical protein